MADTVVASSLTPASNKAGQSTVVRLFKVSDIPAAMDKMKWPVAAALMRHWFNGAPWKNASGGMERRKRTCEAGARSVYRRKYSEDGLGAEIQEA
ncbi:DUF6402 family protein [Pseudomonas parakoreensis]